MTLASEIRRALNRSTTAFQVELKLQDQIAEAFTAAGIAFEREVPILGKRIDFVVRGTCALEVKTGGGTGISPTRQLGGYLEDPRFTLGVLVVAKQARAFLTEWHAKDGRIVPIETITLWKNAL
jgi:hypothetical protein